jgi:hypothetical protein
MYIDQGVVHRWWMPVGVAALAVLPASVHYHQDNSSQLISFGNAPSIQDERGPIVQKFAPHWEVGGGSRVSPPWLRLSTA